MKKERQAPLTAFVITLILMGIMHLFGDGYLANYVLLYFIIWTKELLEEV